jgi:tetratricopeptide (TPR) repeat protein
LSLDELDRIALGDMLFRPVRRALGVTAFGVNAYTGANPGDEVIEPHDETGAGSGHHEELYVVLTGNAEFELDGETLETPAGTLVFVQPDQRRAAKALEADTTILVVGGRPGTAGPPSPFEYWYLAQPAIDAGDYGRAYEIAAEGLAEHPDNPSLNYNLGCYAALAGRREDALRHIGIAFEGDPRAREWAKTDSDLDSIRDELGDPC